MEQIFIFGTFWCALYLDSVFRYSSVVMWGSHWLWYLPSVYLMKMSHLLGYQEHLSRWLLRKWILMHPDRWKISMFQPQILVIFQPLYSLKCSSEQTQRILLLFSLSQYLSLWNLGPSIIFWFMVYQKQQLLFYHNSSKKKKLSIWAITLYIKSVEKNCFIKLSLMGKRKKTFFFFLFYQWLVCSPVPHAEEIQIFCISSLLSKEKITTIFRSTQKKYSCIHYI